MLVMAPYRNMPDDVVALAKKTEADVKGGKIIPFGGPIKDQTGGDKSAAGSKLTDAQIASMNWLVQGIEGKLPA